MEVEEEKEVGGYNNSSNDEELEKEVSESNTQEEKEGLSAIVPKSDDPKPFVAVGETEKEKEVIVQCGDSESGGNSAVVESTNVLKDGKDGYEGAIKHEIPTDNVAAECDDSELTNSAKVGSGEREAAVIVRENGVNDVEESVKNSREDTNANSSLVIEKDKDGGDGETETMKVEDYGEVLKDGGVAVLLLPVAEIGERAEVMTDNKNDGGVDAHKENVETVQGDKAMTKGQDDFLGVDTEVVKEERIVADEEETLGVGEGDVPLFPVAEIGETEEVMADNKNDGGVGAHKENGEFVQGDEAITEGQGDFQGVDTEVVKEERIVADEEEALGVGEGDVPLLPAAENGETEEVMADNKNDGGVGAHKENVEFVQGDEVITEGRGDFQGVDTEVVKEEKIVADEEEALGVGEGDVPLLPVAEIGETEDVMADHKNDGGVGAHKENAKIVQGDEAITEGQDDFRGMNTEVVKEERIAADEEGALGVGEGVKEEGKMVDEEKVVGFTENDEAEAMVADEEKSLDTELETEEEATMADGEKVRDAEIVMETELLESSIKNSAGKRKRGGKNSKSTPKSMVVRRKMMEEDVCFICFDGGDLVLCDRRNCPKAYHPSCVNRDEAFFQTKGRWNCGWHMCSICEKKAEYMCYTCTFSLCKACIKTNVILCVREKEKKGFCEACMKTVMLIEKNSHENQGNIDFDDKSSWEYLFKDYWTDMKAKLNLSLAELVEAKNAWKGSELAGKEEPPISLSDVKDDSGWGSENPSENLETRKTRGRKAKKRKSATKKEDFSTEAAAVASERTSVPQKTDWASKELLEFVMHMKNGNKSIRSQFDVQALLLEYIKTNNLRDSRRKSQIICDARLERLFGKPRVGHFEMLKLLESHFLIKEDCQIDDIQGSVVDTEVSQVDDDEANETLAKGGKDRKRKIRQKGDRGPQSNREDYAAIIIHNISVIYLRRKLVEDLLDDAETFHSKVVGTFVRIRISGANHKQDIYRLVQVTGTTKGAQYAVGKKTTDTMLEILNLNKTESISIDSISNQDFTEDECKRLRQSIKCGLISRLTVGDILDKAMELQVARVNDALETEVMRLSHLRDRASDLGRKKELRECVEKLQVLKTPEERARRLEEFPVIHVDPTMDPNYGSEDDSDTDDKKQDLYKSSAGSRFSKRRDYPSKEWTVTGTPRSSGKNYEFNRNSSNISFSNKVEDATSAHFQPHNENLWDKGRNSIVQQPSISNKPSSANNHVASPKDIPETAPKINEMEKLWHYKDPSGKIQGPFSMVQLRKWSNNKYFPANLRIWRKSEKEDDGMLLTDALEGRFTLVDHSPQLQNSHVKWATTTVEIPRLSPDVRHGLAKLPSPTPNQSMAGLGQMGPRVGASSYHTGNDGMQSPTPDCAQLATSVVVGGNREPNTMGSFGVSTFLSHDSPSTISVTVAPQNSERQKSLQSSQSGQLGAPPGNNMPPQMVQSVAGQTLPVGPYGWSSGPPQNLQPTCSGNMSGQQQVAYNHWSSVPNVVQNPAGNFLPQSAAGLQQPPAPVNLPQPPPPPQQNVSWPSMTANPNMGSIGPTPGNQIMSWGPTSQVPQLTGNVNPPWDLRAGGGNVHPGWVPGPSAQGVTPNQGWVAGSGPTQGPIVSGSGNPNWVGAPGNQGAPPNPGGFASAGNQGPSSINTSWVGGPGNQGIPMIQVPGTGNTDDMGWAAPTGNQGVQPGNLNQGWALPAPRNRAMPDESEQHQNYNRSGFSGQRRTKGLQDGGSGFHGNRRHWDKPGFNNNGRLRDSARSSEH